MRITQNSMNRTQMMGLDASLARLQKTQEGLTSGKRLNRPSDSPVDTVSAMRFRDQQRVLEQLGRNINDGLSRLRATDDVLGRVTDMVQRARQQTVAAANGVNGPQERNAYADEIAQLRKGVLQLANSKYAGTSLFAGTANVPEAFDPSGATAGTFRGNDGAVWRKVTEAASPAGDIDISTSGEAAFGAGTLAVDLVGPGGLLDRIESGLRAGTDVRSELSNLDAALANLKTAMSTVGARTNRLEKMQELNGREDDAAKVALSKVEDVDFLKAAMDLNVQSNAYNAALQASAKVIQPSLMDFLR